MSKNVLAVFPKANEKMTMTIHQARTSSGHGWDKWTSGASAVALLLGLNSAFPAVAASAPASDTVHASPVEAGSPASADEALVRLLAFAADAQGDEYEQAMQAVLQNHAASLPARVAAARFTEASWREDAVASFALARISEPGTLEKLARIPGLNPSQYLTARRAEPTALRDLRAMRSQGWLVDVSLAEVLWKTHGAVALSQAEDFPAAEKKNTDTWRAAEYAALLDGLILVLGQSNERAVHFVLRDVLANESFALRHRALAAGALGQSGAALAEAPLLRAAASHAERLRHGAFMGLGRLATPGAVSHLRRTALQADGKSGDFRVAVSALGRAGAQSTRSRNKDVHANRADIAIALVDALAVADDARDVQATIEAICVVGDGAALTALQSAEARSENAARYARAERRLRRVLARQR